MSGPPPPPPPPHGENPKTTASGGPGLPPGKYDIFIIPEHSAGSGFLYLPSLKPQWNSFIAGVACTLAAVVMGHSLAPAFRAWWAGFQGIGNMGITLLFIAVALGAWSAGKQQADSGNRQDPGGGGGGKGGASGGSRFHQAGGFGGAGAQPGSQAPPGSGAGSGAPPPPPPPHDQPRGGPQSSWHQNQAGPESDAPPPQPPQPEPPKPETPKKTWEKAREETRRREEDRKRKEAEQRRKEETARRLRELREREAREREAREKEARDREAREKAQKEKEAQERERLERELREKLEREIREKAEREAKEQAEIKAAKEREEKERQAAREKETKERQERLEKLRRDREERENREREKKEKEKEEQEKNSRKGSTYAFSAVGEKTSMWPNGKPPAAYSQPTSPAPAAARSATASPAGAGAGPKAASSHPPPAPPSSYAKSGPSTAAKPSAGTEPREEEAYSYRPYDKPKKQAARKKSVSDFSESSWAPSATTTRTTPPPSSRCPYTTNDPDKIVIRAVYGFLNQFSKTPASQLISGMAPVTDGLILRITSAGLFVDDDVRGVAQREWDVKAWTLKLVETGEWKAKGLHLLRITIRDQEGKRYLFVVPEEESWKIAKGLQALRSGRQVRALGMAGLSVLETKTMLETLGWG